MEKVKSVLISVFDKDGLEPLIRFLDSKGVKIYSTGGTCEYIKKLGLNVTSVESITQFPSILGGRVKTLHPKIFGGILNRRYDESDMNEVLEHEIPQIDMVIVDLYPFVDTVESPETTHDEIIEKIDIGGVSLIRAAAKNYADVVIISNKNQYVEIYEILQSQNGYTDIFQRMELAHHAFQLTCQYDQNISNYFSELG